METIDVKHLKPGDWLFGWYGFITKERHAINALVLSVAHFDVDHPRGGTCTVVVLKSTDGDRVLTTGWGHGVICEVLRGRVT